MRNKSILITGGTGYLGTHLVEYLYNRCKSIRIFARDAHKLAEIKRKYPKVIICQGDVKDIERMKLAFRNVDYIIHAAAEKRIEMCESNPIEAVATNIIGTKNVCMAAHYCNVKKVLTVTSDKAYNPITFYGYTKACAEQLTLRFNEYVDKTIYGAIRYGNVWNSTGSVIELWDKLSEDGETLEITDQDMTRFFVKIDEVVKYIVKSLKKMQRRDLFIMPAKSMEMIDIVKSRYPSAKTKIIGLRGAEKMHESLTDGYSSEDNIISYRKFMECK